MFNLGTFFAKYLPFYGNVNAPEETIENTAVAVDIATRFQSEEMVASIVDSFKRGTVGEEILILCESTDEVFNQYTQKLLKQTNKKQFHEVTKRLSSRMAQRECVANEKNRGGIIVRHHFSNSWKYQYKAEYISVDRIDTNYVGDGYQNGIKKDRWGAISSIRIFSDQTKSTSKSVSYKYLTLYSIPWDSIHRYSPLSPLKPTLDGISNLQEYSEYEIKTAKTNADMSIIFGAASYAALQTTAESILKDKRKIGSTEYKEAEEFLTGTTLDSVAGVKYIPKGDEVHNLNMTKNTNFKELTEGSKKSISASVGLSASEAFGDSIMRYTDGLLGQNKSERTFSMDADNLWDCLLEEITMNKIKGLANKGLLMKDDGNGNPIPLSATEFYSSVDEYLNISHFRVTTAHLDPEKTEKATRIALNDNSTATLRDEIGKRGGDYRTQIQQTVRERLFEEQTEKELRIEMNLPKEEEV